MTLRFLALTLLFLVGCTGGDDEGSSADDGRGETLTTRATSTSSSAPAAASRPPIDVITGLVCDEAATRLTGDPEAPNGAWECMRDGEHVRIDYFVDEAEQRKAEEQRVASYRDAGDDRLLSELPVLCGPRFGIGTDTRATRDVLITELQAAEIAASTCGAPDG